MLNPSKVLNGTECLEIWPDELSHRGALTEVLGKGYIQFFTSRITVGSSTLQAVRLEFSGEDIQTFAI